MKREGIDFMHVHDNIIYNIVSEVSACLVLLRFNAVLDMCFVFPCIVDGGIKMLKARTIKENINVLIISAAGHLCAHETFLSFKQVMKSWVEVWK